MDKANILEKSRQENKDKDLYALEVQRSAGNYSSLVSLMIATFFFVIQSIAGQGFNFGLYAVVVSIGATGFVVKAFRMKRNRDIVLAILYTIFTLVLSVAHVYQLITASV